MINYKLLDESLVYFTKCGFTRVEIPWLVSEGINRITQPNDKSSFKVDYNGKCLVGSGEQSFLYQYLKGFLPKGKFMGITPCFRDESYDKLHTKNFIKNELIVTDKVNEHTLDSMCNLALNFFKLYIPQAELTKTTEGYDIVVDGNELGSYGIRSCEFLDWIYGTGCAEPRLSTLIARYGVS